MNCPNMLRRGVLPAILAGIAMTSAVEAKQLSYATGYSTGSIGAKAAEVFAKDVQDNSGGDLTAKVYAQSLLSFSEIPPGIRDGMADSGLVLTPYFPSEFPSTNLATELTMLIEMTGAPTEKVGLAFAGAMAEYVFFNCPSCVNEYEQQNQLFLGGGGTSSYFLICNTPVRTLEEIKGKRLRIGGAQWARWANAVGATPVSIPQHETYEALSQGVVDCSVHSAPELTIVKLMEVTSDMTPNMPGGVFSGVANNINLDVWKSLTPSERSTMLHASAAHASALSWGYAQTAMTNMKTAEEQGIEIHEPDAGLVKVTRDFIEQDIKAVATKYAETHSLTSSAQLVESFRTLLTKWVELVKGVDTSEELTQVYWDEVYSKVNVDTYGQ
ncbi:C4-dicarboxylate TRAP transporter substrate-binding protein [Marinobacter salexigens]|uniref:C4-dicarboxylate TRAP transporter substrate-binding protein n=1 Tax=Marinobacter salexigens TaxID=1925763 RepID=A0ABS6A672_9GAMM|nr:C4-dicarboxylate TRAP transporter substrate-binding protein [Marinobacter salexigens]MBU2873708.1 C4-dicarboxylate TRAP transporter substrate-binding protein [Marinobacter salexigens]